jgi:hypothetical protein
MRIYTTFTQVNDLKILQPFSVSCYTYTIPRRYLPRWLVFNFGFNIHSAANIRRGNMLVSTETL